MGKKKELRERKKNRGKDNLQGWLGFWQRKAKREEERLAAERGSLRGFWRRLERVGESGNGWRRKGEPRVFRKKGRVR